MYDPCMDPMCPTGWSSMREQDAFLPSLPSLFPPLQLLLMSQKVLQQCYWQDTRPEMPSSITRRYHLRNFTFCFCTSFWRWGAKKKTLGFPGEFMSGRGNYDTNIREIRGLLRKNSHKCLCKMYYTLIFKILYSYMENIIWGLSRRHPTM